MVSLRLLTYVQIVLLLRLVPLLPFNMLNYLLSVTPVGVGEYMLASWLGMMVCFHLLPFYILCHLCWWLLWASCLDYPKWLGRKRKKKGSVAVWRHQATGTYYIWLIETLLCNYLLHCLHNCNHLFVCIICCVRLCFISKCAVFLWYLFDTKSILLIIYLHRKLCELWLLTAYSCH